MRNLENLTTVFLAIRTYGSGQKIHEVLMWCFNQSFNDFWVNPKGCRKSLASSNSAAKWCSAPSEGNSFAFLFRLFSSSVMNILEQLAEIY